MASDQPLLSQQEIMRRQSILDACWEQKLIEKEYRREVVGAGVKVSQSDKDAPKLRFLGG